jgi:hypothetical protein
MQPSMNEPDTTLVLSGPLVTKMRWHLQPEGLTLYSSPINDTKRFISMHGDSKRILGLGCGIQRMQQQRQVSATGDVSVPRFHH